MLGSDLYRCILDADSVVEALAHLKDYAISMVGSDRLCVLITDARESAGNERIPLSVHSINISQSEQHSFRDLERSTGCFSCGGDFQQDYRVIDDSGVGGETAADLADPEIAGGSGYSTIYAFDLNSRSSGGAFLICFAERVRLAEREVEVCRFISSHMKQLIEKIQFRKRIVKHQSYENIFNALRMKDVYTVNHSYNVSFYSTLLGKKAGLSDLELDKLKTASLLHDVGKIAIPDAILFKPDSLTEEEFQVVRRHPSVGYDLLSHFPELDYVLPVVRWHHERIDGRGYPDGLAGDEIPFEVRIVSIADAFDAMTSHRVYRDPLPLERIKEQLTIHSGKQFDAQLTEMFLTIVDEQNKMLGAATHIRGV